MTEEDHGLQIKASDITFSNEPPLGTGGFAEVRKAYYNGNLVAFKKLVKAHGELPKRSVRLFILCSFICLPVCQPFHPSIYQSICLSIYLSLHPVIYPSMYHPSKIFLSPSLSPLVHSSVHCSTQPTTLLFHAQICDLCKHPAE